MMRNERVVVTGAAGFIGFHVARHLLEKGATVVGFDNVNSYYTPSLKRSRLKVLSNYPNWSFQEGDLVDESALRELLRQSVDGCVIHLAAQAGVRWGVENPHAYVESNLVGFSRLLEACRRAAVKNLLYASSSSVYGANTKTPFSEHDSASHPVSFYAATKRANELLAHAYSHTFGLPTTGLRFFTVYGPWGRPDMAYWRFAEAILKGTPVTVYGDGEYERDFTYVDDVVQAIARIAARPAAASCQWDGEAPDQATSQSPWRIYNIGNHTPVSVNQLLEILEHHCGRNAIREHVPPPLGDVPRTFADVTDLSRDHEFAPRTPLAYGMGEFVTWLKGWLNA